MHIKSIILNTFAIFIVTVLIADIAWLTAAHANRVYTVANYPVEAAAKDAVTAKRLAIEAGRAAAFRSLMKRIVPVTAYPKMAPLRHVDTQTLMSSVAVKSERSSATRYFAMLDFTFSRSAVQAELKRAAIPFVDVQAPPVIVVPVYRASAVGTREAARKVGAPVGGPLWYSVWADLDLANSPAPITLQQDANKPDAATIQRIINGDFSALPRLRKAYGQALVVLAIAEPDLNTKRLNVALAGQDAAGFFSLKRQYRIDEDDFAYTLSLAAVISQGVIEGRWKEIKAISAVGKMEGLVAREVEIWVEFQSLSQWRRLQQILQAIPGVEDFRTGGLSTDGASVRLRYPGGGEELRNVLADRRLSLERYRDVWILR